MNRWFALSVSIGISLSLVSPAGAEEALEGGGLERLAIMERFEPVPLTNGTFGQGDQGWRMTEGAFLVVTVEEVAGLDGANGVPVGDTCLKFDGGAETQWVPSASVPVDGIRAGVYRLRFSVRTNDLKAPDGSGVRVSLRYRGVDGQDRWPSTGAFRGTFDWRQEEHLFFVTEPEGQRATLSVAKYRQTEGGEAYFDDFILERMVEPPVEVYLRYPNYRGYLADDGPQTVRIWVRVNEPVTGTAPQVEVVRQDNGEKIAELALPTDVNETEIEIDASQWPLGRYAIQARLGDYAHPAYIIQKISEQQRRGMKVWFDENHIAHINGEPTFILGFFNANRPESEARYDRLDLLAEAQPNYAIDYVSWLHGRQERDRYLDHMHARGIWFLDTVNMAFPGDSRITDATIGRELLPGEDGGASPPTPENMDELLTRLARSQREHPGHGGWYVMDERPVDMIVPTFHQYTVLRRADADHPTYGVSDKPVEFFLWRDAMDVFGLDPYPLMDMRRGRPLTQAGNETRIAIDAVQDSRPVWMTLQFFQGFANDRWPTEEELRTMSLMAITEGARGIWYWSFGVRGLKHVTNAERREEYWRSAVAVCRELRSLEPALIAPDALDVVADVSNPRIRWRAREAEGKWYVFAYLPAEKFNDRFEQDPVEVTFTLKNGRQVSRTFRPDTADWFEAAATETGE